MVTSYKLDSERKKFIKSLEPSEMTKYMKSLINILYDSFLEHKEETALNSKRLIEEATNIFKSEGYANCDAIELSMRVQKSNEVLVKILTEKDKQELELSEFIIELSYQRVYGQLYFYNHILGIVLGSYEKGLINFKIIEEIVELIEEKSSDINYFMSKKKDKVVYPEFYEMIVERHKEFEFMLSEVERIKTESSTN